MDETPSKFEAFRSSKGFITFTISYAVFTDSFLYAVMVPMAPKELEKQGFSDGSVQKLITLQLSVFGLACFIASAPCGWISDRYTQRRMPFLLGLIVLLVATAVLWITPFVPHDLSLALLVLGRVLQGIASAVVFTVGLACLVDAVDESEVGKYAGWIGLALNFGNVAGPMLGGVLYGDGDPHGVFGLSVGVIGLDFLLRMVMKDNPKQAAAAAISDPSPESDSASSKEATVEVTSNRAGSSSSGAETTALVQTCSSGRSRTPAVIRLLYSKRFCFNVFGVFTLAIIYTALDTVLPNDVEKVFGWNTTNAGLIFLPFSAPSLLGMLTGKLTDRYGGRWFVFMSYLALCPLFVSLRFVGTNTSKSVAVLVIMLLLIGLCVTIILEPLFAEFARRSTELQEEDARTQRGTRHGYYAQAYAHFNMAWSVGNVVGPVMAGYVSNSGREWPYIVLGIMCGVTAFIVVLYSDGWLFAGRGKTDLAAGVERCLHQRPINGTVRPASLPAPSRDTNGSSSISRKRQVVSIC